VAGWQWDQSTEEISAVRMVPDRAWQWQYWQSCGGLKKYWFIGSGWVAVAGSVRVAVARRVAVAGWQWYRWKEEVSAVRMVVVRAWQWHYWQSCGNLIYKEKNGSGWVAVANKEWVAVARGVAVARWQWHQSMRKVSAVRMVVVRAWQWQYWQSCGGLQRQWQWLGGSGIECLVSFDSLFCFIFEKRLVVPISL
jgi:hypothetical protein